MEQVRFYKLSCELWDEFWDDTELLAKDFRGREIAKQLIRCVGSISANIKEGYGRGYGKEYPQYLRISRGSARESKGWFKRAGKILSDNVVIKRINKLDSIIAMLTKSIQTLEQKNKK